MKRRELFTLIGTLGVLSITGCGNNAPVDTASNDSVVIVSENDADIAQDTDMQTELDETKTENESLKKDIENLETQLSEEEAYYQEALDFGVEKTDVTDVEITETLDEDRLILSDANIRTKDSVDSEWIDYLLRYTGISEENYIHVYGKTSNGWYEIHYITDESTEEYTTAYIPGKALSDSLYITDAKLEELENQQNSDQTQPVTQQQQQTQQPTQQQTQQPTQQQTPTQQQQNQNPPQDNEPVDPSIEQQYQDMIDNGQIIVVDPSNVPGDEFADW